MTSELSRRTALRLIALGTLAGALGACSQNASSVPTQPAAPATALPPATVAIQPTEAVVSPIVEATAPPIAAAVPTTVVATPESAVPTAPVAMLSDTIALNASQFLSTLDDAQRARTSYVFDDAERVRWHWTTPQGFPRNGLPLTEMQPSQRTAALALLQASVPQTGYTKALDIMSLQRDLGNDPEAYYITLFGAPGDPSWGWRWEGHHLSRHFTLKGSQVAATPLFLGAWPTTSDTGLRAMPREEDASRELIIGLPDDLRTQAIFQQNTLTRHVTQNDPEVRPLDPVGISYATLPVAQQQLINEIIQSYLDVMPADTAVASRAKIDAAGLDQLRFGWAGSLEPRKPHYYRIQGPTFLLEYDNSRNGGNHIHSVWREYTADFGRDLA